MPESTLTEKGQTTVPKPIRQHLGLQPGDRIEYILDGPDHVILLRANRNIRELSGILPPPEEPASLEEMDEAIRRRHAKHHK